MVAERPAELLALAGQALGFAGLAVFEISPAVQFQGAGQPAPVASALADRLAFVQCLLRLLVAPLVSEQFAEIAEYRARFSVTAKLPVEAQAPLIQLNRRAVAPCRAQSPQPPERKAALGTDIPCCQHRIV